MNLTYLRLKIWYHFCRNVVFMYYSMAIRANGKQVLQSAIDCLNNTLACILKDRFEVMYFNTRFPKNFSIKRCKLKPTTITSYYTVFRKMFNCGFSEPVRTFIYFCSYDLRSPL